MKAIDRPSYLDHPRHLDEHADRRRVKPGVSTEEAGVATDLIFQQYMTEPENTWIAVREAETNTTWRSFPRKRGRRRYAANTRRRRGP